MSDAWYRPQLLASLSQGYGPTRFFRDLNAGFSVAILALPLSLAIAIASGVAPLAGLATTIVGGALISAFGGTKYQIGGPAAAFIVVVAGVVAAHGVQGLLAATMCAGVCAIGAGMLKLGSLVRLVPQSVIVGFTSGVGVVIALNQIRDFTGIEQALPTATLPKIGALVHAVSGMKWQAIAVGASTIATMLGFRRFAPKFPGLAVAVVAGSLLALALGQVATVASRFGALPQSLPVPMLPDLGTVSLISLLPTALLLAFLIGIESLLSATIADVQAQKRDDNTDVHNPNAELVGQGLANIFSPLFGGLPATGVIARTATNIQAGAETPLAGVLHAVFIALGLFTLAPLVGALALPCLAGVLLVTAWRLLEVREVRHLLGHGTLGDKAALVVTWTLTIFASLEFAIGAGLLVAYLLRNRG